MDAHKLFSLFTHVLSTVANWLKGNNYHCKYLIHNAKHLKTYFHAAIHLGLTPYTCKDCGKAFKYGTTFTEHVKAVHLKQPYICTVCGATFTHFKALQFHMSSFHGRKATVPCDHCEQEFEDKMKRNKHTKLAHSFAFYNKPKVKQSI